MKIANSLIFALFPLLGLSNSIAEPVPEALPGTIVARKTCTTVRKTHCWAGAGKSYKEIWDVPSGTSIPVKCKAYGQTIGGNRNWDQISRASDPWNSAPECWIPADDTSSGCENGVPWC